MPLLSEIQSDLLNGSGSLANTLLKLRFLASRLGSGQLEDWVRHEAEGYPAGVSLPEYRKVGVSYLATFSGPFGSGVRNAPIPPYLINKFGGESWLTFEMRQSVSAISNLVSAAEDGALKLNCADLILLLQGNVYEDMACNSVTGLISQAALAEIQNTVRNRILELTLRIETQLPDSRDIEIATGTSMRDRLQTETISTIANQIIHGNLTNIHTTGHDNRVTVQITLGDFRLFVSSLTDAGITADDAVALGKIISSEPCGTREQPFGSKARKWIARNLGKAVDGTWRVGLDAVGHVLTEATLRYYGLK